MCPMKRHVTVVTVIALSTIALCGCSAPDPEPTQAEKAWHNCIEVLSATPNEFTGDDVTPELICKNQQETWDDFDGQWVDDVAQRLAFYDVKLSDVDVYTE